MNTNGYHQLQKTQQTRLLKLVTESFCSELLQYGADKKDLITVSAQLLDHVTGRPRADQATPPERLDLQRADVEVLSTSPPQLRLGAVALRPLAPEHVASIVSWLAAQDDERTFAVLLPRTADQLHRHLFSTPHTDYFGIFFHDELVGLIGGEHIDPAARKVEMKKFIGEPAYRGQGIGKKAAFLWLYHIFEQRTFNKVYIYSLDTNIRNINLNRRLGFTFEGVLLQDTWIQGRYRDVVRMSLLQSRWDRLAG